MNSFSGAELEKQRFNASKHLQKFKTVKFQGVSRPSCPSLPTPITAPIGLQWQILLIDVIFKISAVLGLENLSNLSKCDASSQFQQLLEHTKAVKCLNMQKLESQILE